MGSIPSELSFDFRPSFVPKRITDFLKELSMVGNVSQRASKLDAFVNRLEEEMRKIDAFKRELPLCMLLLNDAIVALKDESMRFSARNAERVLEEFIPLKENHSDDDDEGYSISTRKENESITTNTDKKSWMSSVQLWNTNEDCHSVEEKTATKREMENSFQGYRTRGGLRAFVPFKGNSVFSVRKEEKGELQVQGLSLLTSGMKNLKEESGSTSSRNSFRRVVSSAPSPQSNFRSGQQPPQQQTGRKRRRCWSPELHRRFVNALQQLGGCQVATPKQIRELMQVHGLTNDQVKSHLQKYRLHRQRMPAVTSSRANQSMVVLGSGLRMSQDQHVDSLKASNLQSGSPEGHLQLATNNGGTSTTGGNSMDDSEDAKSESYSWETNVNRPGKDV